ncbi:cytochrome c3 family protein [Desulfuromonas sp. AOP6]|uniref:cytochrome c3 family protein n=1 Tax=Desulfuromonas sp. AOP6 TaxID=1566351 RepID=UPI001276547A|nr:cytochrome c3 family protein [Desulfuromonas sp. AOP6]BCA78669.1 cytochrome c [Desulfuromonas sp. AOP6]
MIRCLIAVMAVTFAWALPALAVDFDHAEHLTYIEGTDCATCHVEGAQSIVPETSVCLQCHDQDFVDTVEMPGLKTHGPVWALNHRPFAKGNTYDCAACHQQSYCMDCHTSGRSDEMGDFGNNMINVHRSDFHVTHPIAARTNQQLCSSCHEPNYCSDCHNQFAPADLALDSHRRGWTDGTLDGMHAQYDETQCAGCHTSGSVIPSTTGWSQAHAREARKNLATCQACHPQGDICLKCHSATTGLRVNPHPADWSDIDGRLKRASDGKTCRKCH